MRIVLAFDQAKNEDPQELITKSNILEKPVSPNKK